MSEFQTLSIVRAVAELAEERHALIERVRRVEEANVELQQELERQKADAERWKTMVQALEAKAEA